MHVEDRYCHIISIVDRPYIPSGISNGLPPSPVFGEVYDLECPYKSNPPADYSWTRLSSCGYDGKLLSWPPSTIIFNNKKSVRLDGVIPAHNGYYKCEATNAYGSKSWCFWNRINGNYALVVLL